MTTHLACEFILEDPLNPLPRLGDLKLCDVHVHVWEKTKKLATYLDVARRYGVQHVLSLDNPELKQYIDDHHPEYFSHAYYLSSRYFALKKVKLLLDQIAEARKHGYGMYKMWFGPRFLDFAKADGPFHLNDRKFLPIFQELEADEAIVFIHVGDPDTWYQTRYLSRRKYGTKKQALLEFKELLGRYPRITFVGYHLAGCPEHLDWLDDLLNDHDNLFLDTGSTRWMIRELGKNVEHTREFFVKHADRVMLGIDLSIHEDMTVEYVQTRYWSQRLFWETDYVAPLPFYDEDSSGNTVIRGIKLPLSVLRKFYWMNARQLLRF